MHSGALFCLEVVNALMQPDRAYQWAGMEVTAMHMLVVRLGVDFMVFAQVCQIMLPFIQSPEIAYRICTPCIICA